MSLGTCQGEIDLTARCLSPSSGTDAYQCNRDRTGKKMRAFDDASTDRVRSTPGGAPVFPERSAMRGNSQLHGLTELVRLDNARIGQSGEFGSESNKHGC